MCNYGVIIYSILISLIVLLAQTEEIREIAIIGGGLSGIISTIVAAENGKSVVLCEKESHLGGNSAKATSGINAANTVQQDFEGIDDDFTSFENDTKKSGVKLNEALVKILTYNSAEALKFLEDRINYSFDDVVKLGGHSQRRTHRFKSDENSGKPKPVGFTIMTLLINSVNENIKTGKYNIKIVKNCRLSRVKKIDDYYILYADDMTLRANSIIFTSGGFGNDHDKDSLIEKYAQKLNYLPTTNGKWTTGDGMKILESMGADLIDMDKIQIHPTGFLQMEQAESNIAFLAPESLRGCGAKLILKNGKRFVDELEKRNVVTAAIFEKGFSIKENNPRKGAYIVISSEDAECFGKSYIEFYVKLKRMMGPYNSQEIENIVANGEKFEFEYSKKIDQNTKYYLGLISPVIHYCMGGVKIDENAKVIDRDSTSNVLSGIFAAGEVTGGIHGENRLGGNSLLDCVVFGKIAATSAVNYVDKFKKNHMEL
ncbi:NADH-dependent fumarate reductase [Intoshia linei]|uniref:NADH-dependent fumarate reductase n=1 Tax=Intoshia linei TaxID=1819745 RepID=A0A177B5G0_9BILA|nr:NADH-dependent fumarate reductase [Intoshia linei]